MAGDSDVLANLQRSDIVMNAIVAGVGSHTNRSAYSNPGSAPPDIVNFVQATGGSLIRKQPPATALRALLKDVVTRYVLQYPAPAAEPGTFRHIRVELSPAAKARYPTAEIQARSGYRTGGQ